MYRFVVAACRPGARAWIILAVWSWILASGCRVDREREIAAARAGWPRVAVALPAPEPPPLPRGRVTLDAGAALHAFPPLRSAAQLAAGAAGLPAPAVVMLHGMCMDPLSTCAYWSDAREGRWLLCPQGNAPCGDASDWRGDGAEKAEHIDAAVEALRRRHGAYLSRGADVLAGFSRGAFVARDVAYARPGRYRGLVLMGAALKPDPDRLRASGIRRVVLAAGDFDGARPTMQLATALLNRGGVEARYMSLGPIHHQLPDDLADRMRQALRWIDAAAPGAVDPES